MLSEKGGCVMNKWTKIWIITAAILILIGCMIFGGMMMALKWDFAKLSTVKFETNNYVLDTDFSNISVKTDTADIVFAASQDGSCSVVCYAQKNLSHSVAVKDGTLAIELVDTRNWYDHIGIIAHTPKITVYLPDGQYDTLSIKESTGDIEIPEVLTFETIDISLSTGDVKNYASASNVQIKTTTGDIHTESISADNMELSVTTGDITARSVACKGDLKVTVRTGDAQLTDVVCNTLTSTGSTGDITLENVTAAESFSITRTTGDVTFKSCDAGSLKIQTDTGDVTGNLLGEKIFITQTSTGNVTVPQSTTGGICEINTSTGDIKITVG